MNLDRVTNFVQRKGLKLIKRATHSSGAEVFIADGYFNFDPEFDRPHYQTWFHVAFGEDKPLAGQPLYFTFGNQVSQADRVAAAEKTAETLIKNVVDAYGREHG